jgi:apolipoprotein N-acyltransferase
MTSHAQRAAHIRSRVRDYVLYVLIAFAFLGMVFVVEGTWGHDAFIRWGGLAGFTSGLFGYFINESRQYFRERRFWTLTAILMAVHVTAFAIVLTHVEEWKLMWFMVMVLEHPVFAYLRSRLQCP